MEIRMRSVRFLNAVQVRGSTTFHLNDSDWEMHLRDGMIWVKSKRARDGRHFYRGYSFNNVVEVNPYEEDLSDLFDDEFPAQLVAETAAVEAAAPQPEPTLPTKPARKPRRRLVKGKQEGLSLVDRSEPGPQTQEQPEVCASTEPV